MPCCKNDTQVPALPCFPLYSSLIVDNLIRPYTECTTLSCLSEERTGGNSLDNVGP